jgi:phage I-like protein
MAIQRASHTFSLEPAGDGWHDLLPSGRFGGRDGRGPYLNDRPDGILAAFEAQGMPLAIDYHHQSLDADKKVGLVPGAGWGKELRIEGGRVQARIEWTAAAQAAIDAKEVMYLSPVFEYDEASGRVLRIACAGLTNLPNLHLAPLTQHAQGKPMEEIRERICHMLNLPAASTDQELGEHLDRLKAMLVQAEAATAAASQLRALVGQPEAAPVAEALRAACARLAPGASVPRAEYERVAHALAKLEGDQRAAQADAAVRAAMSQGKVAPAMEQWARDYAAADLAGFEKYAAAAPAIVGPGQGGHGKPPPAGPGGGARSIAAAATEYQAQQAAHGAAIDDVAAVLHVFQSAPRR